MPENPELMGMGAIILALITAWSKMRPAMRKIEAEEDASLRSDLLKRVGDLEISHKEKDAEHSKELKDLRNTYEKIIEGMQRQADQMRISYEQKLRDYDERLTRLLDQRINK